jgi:hypothetical protein
MATVFTDAKRLRVLRTSSVLVVNGLLAYNYISNILQTRAAQRVDPVLHFQVSPLSLADIFWIAPLLIGFVAELTSYRVAWITNVGYYAVSALYICIAFALAIFKVLGFSEPEHWVLAAVFIALPSALFATYLYWLYRQTPPEAPAIAHFA